MLADEASAAPKHGADQATGYVPEIIPPPPVHRCSGHRCRRRRVAPWIAAKDLTDRRKSVCEKTKYEDKDGRRQPIDEREKFSALASGRYMCVRLDKRCWLEVEDQKHRYAKNLRRYHFEWMRLNRPLNDFWLWLDQDPPQMEKGAHIACSREKLNSETVLYCPQVDRRKFALTCVDGIIYCFKSNQDESLADGRSRVISKALSPAPPSVSAREEAVVEGPPASSPEVTKKPLEEAVEQSAAATPAVPTSVVATPDGDAALAAEDCRFFLVPLNTGSKGWIFVLHDGVMYARRKRTSSGSPRFHHSSFFGGECVDAAGVIFAREGVVERMNPHSGHYRPREAHLARLLYFFSVKLELDLRSFDVDVQRLLRVSRPEHSKKIDTPYYWAASDALAFLAHKSHAKSSNLLRDLESRFKEHEDEYLRPNHEHYHHHHINHRHHHIEPAPVQEAVIVEVEEASGETSPVAAVPRVKSPKTTTDLDGGVNRLITAVDDADLLSLDERDPSSPAPSSTGAETTTSSVRRRSIGSISLPEWHKDLPVVPSSPGLQILPLGPREVSVGSLGNEEEARDELGDLGARHPAPEEDEMDSSTVSRERGNSEDLTAMHESMELALPPDVEAIPALLSGEATFVGTRIRSDEIAAPEDEEEDPADVVEESGLAMATRRVQHWRQSSSRTFVTRRMMAFEPLRPRARSAERADMRDAAVTKIRRKRLAKMSLRENRMKAFDARVSMLGAPEDEIRNDYGANSSNSDSDSDSDEEPEEEQEETVENGGVTPPEVIYADPLRHSLRHSARNSRRRNDMLSHATSETSLGSSPSSSERRLQHSPPPVKDRRHSPPTASSRPFPTNVSPRRKMKRSNSMPPALELMHHENPFGGFAASKPSKSASAGKKKKNSPLLVVAPPHNINDFEEKDEEDFEEEDDDEEHLVPLKQTKSLFLPQTNTATDVAASSPKQQPPHGAGSGSDDDATSGTDSCRIA